MYNVYNWISPAYQNLYKQLNKINHMETIECYKCCQCNKLLPKDTSDYFIISGLKLEGHLKSKHWDPNSYTNKLICEYTPVTSRLFCTTNCIYQYIGALVGDKE